MDFTYEDLADMHVMYGLFQGNGREARSLYHERFLSLILPSHTIFISVNKRLWKTDSSAISITDKGYSGTVCTSEKEEQVLNSFRETPSRNN